MSQNLENSTTTTSPWPPVTPSTFPTLLDLVAMAGIFFVVQLLVGGVGMVVLAIMGQPITNLAPATLGSYMAWVSGISMTLTLALLILYRRLRRGEAVKIHFAVGRFNLLLVVWSFVLMMSLGVVMEPLYNLLPSFDQQFGEGFGSFLAVVIFAPLFEEIICRGLVYGSLLRRHSKWLSMLLSALFFGVLHVQPVPMINAVLMGLVLAFVYDRCQTIWAPIMLHALNNGVAFVMMQLGYGETTMSQLLEGHPVWYAILYGLSLVVAVGSVWGMVRSLKQQTEVPMEVPTTPEVEPAEQKIEGEA